MRMASLRDVLRESPPDESLTLNILAVEFDLHVMIADLNGNEFDTETSAALVLNVVRNVLLVDRDGDLQIARSAIGGVD